MKTKTFILILSIGLQNLIAQNYVDIARLYFNTTGLNQFKNSSIETRINEIGLDIIYPIVTKQFTILTGLMIESTEVRLAEFEEQSNLSSYTIRLGFNKKHSERWSGTYLVIPKLASDFNESSKQNFQIGAAGLLRYNKNEYLNYKIGLYYNSELFGPLVSPIFGFYYGGPSKKLEVNVLLPSTVDINYRVINWMNVGLNFTGQIKSYRIRSLINNIQPAYLHKTSNEICSYFKINFSKNISVQTRLGYSVGRTYNVFDDQDKIDFAISLIKFGNDRTQLNTNFTDGFLFQTILLYRFVQN